MYRSRIFWFSFAGIGLLALGKFVYSCFCRYRRLGICEDADIENNDKNVGIKKGLKAGKI